MAVPSAALLAGVTGRCYCGAVSLRSDEPPETVAYCHCADCKRITGAPLPAFAAFRDADFDMTDSAAQTFSVTKGVQRWFCRTCGSPLAARFDYLPGQVYVPLGVLDQAMDLPPQMHCHSERREKWLCIDDDLPRVTGSARDALTSGADGRPAGS